MSTDLQFSLTTVPEEDSPLPDDAGPADPEAPYGRTPTGRIRKRPVGNSTPRASGNGKRNDKLAADAASILARGNSLIGMSLAVFGMPLTAEALKDANDTFETMAREALVNDPALCRKILTAGATGGKTGLVLAYGMLAGSIGPTAFMEVKARRALMEAQREQADNG